MDDLSYYDILGLDPSASQEDVRKAYRKLAMQFHPDKNRGTEEESASMFKLVSEAYEVLSDEEKRNTYDRHGKAGLEGRFGEEYHHDTSMDERHAEDIFQGFFGRSDPFGAAFGGGFRASGPSAFGAFPGFGSVGGSGAGAGAARGNTNRERREARGDSGGGGGGGASSSSRGDGARRRAGDRFGNRFGDPFGMMGGRFGGGLFDEFFDGLDAGGGFGGSFGRAGSFGNFGGASAGSFGGGGGGSSSSSMAGNGFATQSSTQMSFSGGVTRTVRTTTTTENGQSVTRTSTTLVHPDGRREESSDETVHALPGYDPRGRYQAQQQELPPPQQQQYMANGNGLQAMSGAGGPAFGQQQQQLRRGNGVW